MTVSDLHRRSQGVFGVVDFGKSSLCAPDESLFGADLLRRADPIAQDQSPRLSNLRILADVSLHNRYELGEALELDHAESRSSNDADLILRAYEKWGEDCPRFLLGEFAFAVWDQSRTALFCCRDHFGQRPFLYWATGVRFWFAGDIRLLAGLDKFPRGVNRRKLAALAVPDGQDFYPEETFYDAILSLPSASWMTVSRDHVRKGKYWEPQTGLHSVPRRPEDADEGLREILFRAVECRIDPERPAVATLSGGLDSSSIVSIASRCLQRKNRDLTVVAGVLPESSRAQFRDERDYIDEFRDWPNVTIRYVTGEGRGPFDQLGDGRRFAAFFLHNPNFYLADELDRAAEAEGARWLLDGVGGELGPTASGSRYFPEMLLSFRWINLARELAAARRVRGVSPFRLLGSEIRTMLWPQLRIAGFPFLNRDFARECRAKPVLLNGCPNHQRFLAATLRRRMLRHEWRGQDTLMPHAAPFLDRRVVDYCLSMPGEFVVRGGMHRRLIRGALRGILPERIRQRTDKAPFSPDYGLRFHKQLGLARSFVSQIGPQDPVRSILDIGKLMRTLQLEDPLKSSRFAWLEIPLACYLIAFLRQFPEFRA